MPLYLIQNFKNPASSYSLAGWFAQYLLVIFKTKHVFKLLSNIVYHLKSSKVDLTCKVFAFPFIANEYIYAIRSLKDMKGHS